VVVDSGSDSALQLVERELGGGLASALAAPFHVAPGTEEAGTLGIETYDERLRFGVDVDAEVGPPPSRRVVVLCFQPLQDAPETHPLDVEEPRAVARFQDEGIHWAILPLTYDDHAATMLRLCDERIAVGCLPPTVTTGQILWDSIACTLSFFALCLLESEENRKRIGRIPSPLLLPCHFAYPDLMVSGQSNRWRCGFGAARRAVDERPAQRKTNSGNQKAETGQGRVLRLPT